VDIRRPDIDEHSMTGFVAGASERLVLLHLLNTDTMVFNGYSALRRKHIKEVRQRAGDGFLNRLAALKGWECVPQPKLDLMDTRSAIGSGDTLFPLTTIHMEEVDDSVCYIGRVQKLGRSHVVLDEIDPSANWTQSRRYAYRDITRIDFGGGYEAALLFVNAHERDVLSDNPGDIEDPE
jgi:hypothetical protein